jgi:Fe-S-cluster containining protein
MEIHGCTALQDDVRCGTYARRPSVRRAFPVIMADGSFNPECVRLCLHGVAAWLSNPALAAATEVLL